MLNYQEAPKEDFLDGLIQAMDEGIASGVGNFFSNIWVGVGRFQEDFLGFDDYNYSRVMKNIIDNERFIKCIKNIIENKEVLYHMMMSIIDDTMSQLSYKQQERIFESVVKASTRNTISFVIAGKISLTIVDKISNKLAVQFTKTVFWRAILNWAGKGFFWFFALEALLERASEGLKILKLQNPVLYNKLSPTCCDMLYFIFKPVVKYIKYY